MPCRIGVLISGGGRTALNLAERFSDPESPARIVLAIAHDEALAGVARCRDKGIPVTIVPLEPRDSLSDRIDAALEDAGVEMVCLCGYLRYFRVGTRWSGSALNIHPSLLPDFGGAGMYGEHVHSAVLEAGRTESGCTVHIVDEEYDHGPVVLQRSCPVLPDDTPQTLAARVFELECDAYPDAVRQLVACGCGQEENGIT